MRFCQGLQADNLTEIPPRALLLSELREKPQTEIFPGEFHAKCSKREPNVLERFCAGTADGFPGAEASGSFNQDGHISVLLCITLIITINNRE